MSLLRTLQGRNRRLSGPKIPVLTLASSQATTSGTEFDFTDLPAGIKYIAVIMSGNSLSGTDSFMVQLGDSGGIEATGYTGSVSQPGTGGANWGGTFAQLTNGSVAANAYYGACEIRRFNSSHLWIFSSIVNSPGQTPHITTGTKTLSAELTQVRLSRSGTNTFDAGSVTIQYQ